MPTSRSAFAVPIRLLAVVAAFFGVGASTAAARAGTYTVSGVVRSSTSDEPLGGAVVDLRAGSTHGVVGATVGLRPLPGASVLVVGARRTEVTDSSGQFFAPVKTPGTYFLRIARPGYAMQMLPIEVPPDRTVETPALLDSSKVAVRPGTEELWAEFDKRAVWHGMNSALVSGRAAYPAAKRMDCAARDALHPEPRSTPSYG